MSEQRKYPRATAQGIAAYVWVHEKLSSAIIENISAGGLFFRTPKPAPLGTPVRIRLVQPGLKRAIELAGSVVNALEPKEALADGLVPGCGIRFDPIPELERQRFNLLLDSLGLPPIESAPLPRGVQTAPARAAKPKESFDGGYHVDYSVHDAELKIEALPVPQRAPVPSPDGSTADAASAAVPEPVAFEFELSKPGIDENPEVERLMGHIQGLMKQLAELEEKLVQRDLQVDLQQTELQRLKADLAAYQHKYGEL